MKRGAIRFYAVAFGLSLALLPAVWAQAGSGGGGKTGIGGTAFEIMDRVFQQLQFAEGHQKLQLTITTREGKSVVYKASLYQKQNASFYVFDSMTRGTVLKLLYNDQGQNI